MPLEEVTRISTEKDAAEAFVKKHVVPGTLFTAGMRFYQVKESMADGKSVTLQKNGGKSKILYSLQIRVSFESRLYFKRNSKKL